MSAKSAVGIYIIGLGLLAMALGGCATPRCKPLPPIKIGRLTVFPDVCPRAMIDHVCGAQTKVYGCTYRRDRNGLKCWIMLEDSADGAKAMPHELEHCAGGDEHKARCDDWPGTIKPVGQECIP